MQACLFMCMCFPPVDVCKLPLSVQCKCVTDWKCLWKNLYSQECCNVLYLYTYLCVYNDMVLTSMCMYSTYVSVSNSSTLCTEHQSVCTYMKVWEHVCVHVYSINQTQSPAAVSQDLFCANIFSSLSVENYAIRKHPARLTAGSHTIWQGGATERPVGYLSIFN